MHQDGDNELNRRIEHPEKEHPGVNGLMSHEKGVEQAALAEEEGEEVEHNPHLKHAEGKALEDVFLLVMADLVRKDRNQFGDRVLRDEGIEERNPFVISEPRKKRV